ncbi:MAG: TlpA family protein disulfide reductase [Candidatus Cloacimonetes bacterium]|nr:TlpA family protein disulfide reductase [Candidatus Cloacimonadota bacterium]
MKIILLLLCLLVTVSLLYAEKMPDFKLPDISGKEVKLEDLLNKGPVIIDFWASWCAPCKKGMAALNKLAEKSDSLTVVVVSIDAPKDIAKAKSYLKSSGYKFIALFDSDKKLAKRLNVVNPPRTYIIDKTGEIVLIHDGYEPGTEKIYEEKIREMIYFPGSETIEPDKTEFEHCGKHQ